MEKLIAIVGLTSSGKSTLGIELANFFNGEIVSADSRQVYEGLDWCSGKVSKEEQAQAVHHLLDVCPLGKRYTLFDFQSDAYKEIDNIILRHKLPILVGGTGLYVRAVTEGYSLTNDKPNEELRKTLEQKSLDELICLAREKNIDIPAEPTARRLARLLEKNETALPNNPKYDVLMIGIKWSREDIYERIKLRLEARMPFMIEEIKNLLQEGVSKEFLLSLGLEAKYIIWYLDGKFSSYEEFFEELFKEERHFAKRQQTWFNKDKNIIWLDAKDHLPEKAKNIIEKFLKN